jgi:hypothetical protein
MLFLSQNSYVKALVAKSLAKVTDRPIFTSYPAYDPEKAESAQGFNLLDANDRAAALTALAHLRHNMICACPIAGEKK